MFSLEELDQIVALGVCPRRDSDEGNLRGTGAARVVDGVADIDKLARWATAL